MINPKANNKINLKNAQLWEFNIQLWEEMKDINAEMNILDQNHLANSISSKGLEGKVNIVYLHKGVVRLPP